MAAATACEYSIREEEGKDKWNQTKELREEVMVIGINEKKVDSKKNQPIIFTEDDRELLLNLDKRLRKLEFAFTPQGLAKGIESVFRQKTEQAPEMQESP